jgi:hypothetical protein
VEHTILNLPIRLIHGGPTHGHSDSMAACLALWWKMHPARQNYSIIIVEESVYGEFILETEDIEKLILPVQ